MENVAPLRGRGLKYILMKLRTYQAGVAPLRGRGLKSLHLVLYHKIIKVAPLRGRGLKFLVSLEKDIKHGRPLAGAWIEILKKQNPTELTAGSPPCGGVD